MAEFTIGRQHPFILTLFSLLLVGRAIPGAAQSSNAPFFTAAGVVQAATQTAVALAPNTIATIYGTNLSWTTHAVTAADLNGGTLPVSLDGVLVYVNNIECNLLFVSPGQINFLVPYEIVASSARVLVARQGVAGPFGADGKPSVVIPLDAASPGFFQWNGNFAVAQHADGTLIADSAPAVGGEIVVLYAEGLGRTNPDTSSGTAPRTAMPILAESQLQILLDGSPLPRQNVYYAGVTPGFAGLYQVNLRLPDLLSPDPEIRIAIGSRMSPAGVLLYAN